MRNKLITVVSIVATIMIVSPIHAEESASDLAIKDAEKAIESMVGAHENTLDAARRVLERAKMLRERNIPIGCEKVANKAREIAEGAT